VNTPNYYSINSHFKNFFVLNSAKFLEISRSLQQSIKKDKQDTFAYQPEAVGPKTAFFTFGPWHEHFKSSNIIQMHNEKRKCMDHSRLYKPRQYTIGSHNVLWKIYQTLL